jgi:hypothetical protein
MQDAARAKAGLGVAGDYAQIRGRKKRASTGGATLPVSPALVNNTCCLGARHMAGAT